MNILSILNLFGGVGLFLFGMSLMGSSLQKLAGGGLEKILETLTTSKRKGVGAIKGWGLGVIVTGIIQSSSATTLMLIGFVNAGIMKLGQAIPVVFGANVGSTFTAQILRLGDLGSGSLILKLLKPSSFAPMLLAVGMFITIATKKKKNQRMADVAGIMIGLGLLFYGMTKMEGVFAPLKDSPEFQKLFTSFSNPLIGILTGILLTAVIQSSSAAVGILQALSASGSVTYGIALPFILGQNVGKCMPIILGAIGASKKAKRVSISYILFNIVSTVSFAVIIYGIHYTVGLPILANVMNRGDIANVHLAINLITSLCLLPFCNQVSAISRRITGDSDINPVDEELRKLDDRLLQTPGIALNQCINLINRMSEKIMENFNISTGLISEYEEDAFTTLEDNESFLDKCETALSAYIIRINRKHLTPDNKLVVAEILHSVGDFERIGDYCMNIAYTARSNHDDNIVFSEAGKAEIDTIVSATKYTLETLTKSFSEDDGRKAIRIEPMAHTINNLKDIIKSHHVDRLQVGDCGVEGGVALADLTNSFERIASHAANIALHIIKRTSGDQGFDEMHGHVEDTNSEEYRALENYYFTMYIQPVLKNDKKSKVAKRNEDIDNSNNNTVDKDNKKADNKKAKREQTDKETANNRKTKAKDNTKNDTGNKPKDNVKNKGNDNVKSNDKNKTNDNVKKVTNPKEDTSKKSKKKKKR